MIEVERLAELRHPSVLISSPLPTGTAAQRLRRGVAAGGPSDRFAVFGEIDYEDSVVLWARPRHGVWAAPWKLRGELVPAPGGCELRAAVGPFRHAAPQAIAYGLVILWVLGCGIGAVVAAVAGAPADAWGAGIAAAAGLVVAVVLAVKDSALLRLAQPSIEYLLAWTADTLDAAGPNG